MSANKTAFWIRFKSGLVSGSFDADKGYVISLKELPMVPLDLSFGDLKNTFELAAGGRLLTLILKAMFKGSSSTLTRDQIKELRQ